MTHARPIPAGNQSPYPLQQPPSPAPAPVAEAQRETPDRAWLLTLGATIGLGAALVGGVAYGLASRRGRG